MRHIRHTIILICRQAVLKIPNGNVHLLLCVWLHYQIRCNYFHTNTAVPLLSYADDPLLKALLYTNYFVEHFVEEHLPEWMMEKTLTEEQREKILEAYMRFAK